MKRLISMIMVIVMTLSLCTIPKTDVHAYGVTAAATNDYTTWKQTSSTWGNARPWPRASTPLFGDAGCWITSMAILLRHYNVVTDSNVKTFNPLICNNALMKAGVVDLAGDATGPQNISKAYAGISYAGSKGYSVSNVKNLYNSGYAIIVHETKGHYVAVRSVSGNTITVMDPGSRATTLSNSDSIQYFKVSKQTNVSLNINPTIKKTSMRVGDTCIVGGNVTSNGSAISSVTAGVYRNSNGSSCVNGIQATRNPNSYNYNLSYIDSAIHFEKITEGGTYYFVVKATLQNGTTKTAYKQFSVNGGTCSTPNISFSDVQGGKSLRIAGGGADTIRYSIKKNGKEINSGSASGSYSTTLNSEGTYSVSAYSSRSGYKNSGTRTSNTSIQKVEAPVITQSVTGNHIALNMTSKTSGAIIYYTTSGNTPTTGSNRYNGVVTVDSEKTVKAIAVKNGCINSDVSVSNVKLEEPEAPKGLTLTGESKVGTGEAVSVKWNSNIMASSYVATLYKDGKKVDSMNTTGTSASFILSNAGKYQIKVYAVNFVGNSAESSETVDIEAFAPSTVKFVDWDGKLIKSQEVAYGKDATLPEDLERKGYTFTGWENEDQIKNVKSDLTVTAKYKINIYSVKFYEASGKQVGSTQKVQYQGAATSPESELTDIPKGYIFAGWKVIESDKDSKGDYKAVDSDMKLQAVYYWENDDLPVLGEITSANWNATTGNYNIKVKLTNYPKQDTTALLRVSLMTKDGKMVKSSKEEVEISADKTIEKEVTLKYSGKAKIASAVVLGLDGDNLTGSAYSKEVKKEVTVQSDTVWSEWSDWTTSEQTTSDDTEVEKKTQYRYADKQTTTSSSSSMNGWTQYNSTSSWGNWGNWSGWGTASQTANDYKQVETRKEYRYYCFYCPVCGGREPLQGKSDCGKYTLTSSNWRETWSPVAYKDSKSGTYSYTKAKRYTTSLGDGARWNFSNGNLNSTGVGTKDSDSSAIVIRNAYRYRTRSKNTTYYFYKWNDWSNWGDTEYTSSDSRKVETRTLYRTRKKVPVYSDLAGTEETGTEYKISGKLTSVKADLKGKCATIMVYKGKNTDPKEDQIQYVGQTVIGENNSYSFSVIPKSDPTNISGDYTVCLGLEGSTGLVNVDVIQAPKATYTVKYVDSDGKVLSTQKVKEGDNAEVPESPQKDGQIFIGWNANAMNVQGDLTITAVYAPVQYTVAFVDSVNNTISFDTYKYGEKLTPPNISEVEGREFVGWDAVIDGKDTVKNNMVVNAVYKTQKFKVEFLDDSGKVINTQNVEYGQTAVLPPAIEVSGKQFLGWSTDKEWWNVTSDMQVKPILVYNQSVSAPTYYFEEFDDYVAVYFETETEDVDVYYTTDGTQPDRNSTKYDGEAVIIDNFDIDAESGGNENEVIQHLTANLKAIAVAKDQNDSEVQDIVYEGSRKFTIDDSDQTEPTEPTTTTEVKPTTTEEKPTTTETRPTTTTETKPTTETKNTCEINGHKWSYPWEITKEPTVFATGKREVYCVNCDKKKEQSIAKLKPTIKLSATKKTIKRKKSYTLTISKLARADAVKKVTVNNKKIVKIKKAGKNKYKITAKNKKGKVKITVTLTSKKKATCQIRVK